MNKQDLKKLEEQKLQLRVALMLVMDSVDYTSGACTRTEMVGAVLPESVLKRAKQVLLETKAA